MRIHFNAKLVEGILSNKHPLYPTWRGMKARCYNFNHKHYKHYGGRGVNICDRWLNSFRFFVLDIGKRPTLKHTIDRIDNDKGYYKKNCRWVTMKEQNSNRRKIDWLKGEEHHNSKLSDKEIAEIRMLYKTRYYYQYKLGEIFNISTAQVSRIVNNKRRTNGK